MEHLIFNIGMIILTIAVLGALCMLYFKMQKHFSPAAVSELIKQLKDLIANDTSTPIVKEKFLNLLQDLETRKISVLKFMHGLFDIVISDNNGRTLAIEILSVIFDWLNVQKHITNK